MMFPIYLIRIYQGIILVMRQIILMKYVKKSLDAGMNAHIAKPVEPATMYRTISKQLTAQNQQVML